MRASAQGLYVRAFSPVTSHSFNPLSLFTCNWFCGSGIFGVTSQDFNTPFGPWTVFVVEVDWSYSPMVRSRVVLSRVVLQIVFTWFPEDVKLSLGGLVLEPIELRVEALERFCLMVLVRMPRAATLSVLMELVTVCVLIQ